MSGRDQAIATVVARPYQDDDRDAGQGAQVASDSPGDLQSCAFHQRVGGHAGLLGPGLDALHLFRRDNFHRSTLGVEALQGADRMALAGDLAHQGLQ